MAAHRNTRGDQDLPDLVLPIEDRDHHRGPIGARYSVVEYGDFASEPCRDLVSTLADLARELEDELCLAFRSFPDEKAHPHAQRAAEVAEAAEEQGKFWLMHDRLFEHQSELGEPLFQKLARELPLDMEVFERDLRSGAAARRVAEDVESGVDAGVEQTPTLFLNGRMHAGSYEFDDLLDAIRKAPASS
jgi:protein-disulfide isomerase